MDEGMAAKFNGVTDKQKRSKVRTPVPAAFGLHY